MVLRLENEAKQAKLIVKWLIYEADNMKYLI